MDDQSKSQKKPEARGKAPASPPPFSSMLPPSYFDIYRRSPMLPSSSWNLPSPVPPPGKPYNYFSSEEDPEERASAYNASSTAGPFRRPSTPRPQKNSSVPIRSPPASLRTSYRPTSVHEEEERITRPRGHRRPCSPGPEPGPSQKRQKKKPNPLDNKPLDNDLVSQALDRAVKEQVKKTLERQRENAVEKDDGDNHDGRTSPTSSLSQDLEKKMHSSLKSYDANMERLSKDINEGCDRLRERFDRLEKYKRERDALDAIADPPQEAVKMFPGPIIQGPGHRVSEELTAKSIRDKII
ncbi:hypothetical protein NW768_002605 [Fusarium equiseti]|uniref:Uncharacterized protein n=1 Tax=Fusarium equiseti TaxID=61235 RepID=A0ABQ8RP20_FUSEQ|nr:hypothetical protein NW768_002605 [Fusarium equiseti]